jgi:hypothetical protein
MADKGAFTFGVLEFSPGNPQFPTLPTGPLQGTIVPFGEGASLTFERAPVITLEEYSAPGIGTLFHQTYLGTTWVSPVPVEFGNITATKTRVVTLHNTRRFAAQLTAIDVSAIPGLSVLSPGLPIFIDAYSSVLVTFEVTTTGDPVINDDVIFTVDGGDILVRFTGRRLIIFDTLPQKPISEKMTWITDRMISINGTEQVMEIRQLPRSELKLVQRFTDHVERTRQINVINAAGFLRVGVQLWFEAREITQAAAAIDTIIQISTLDMEIDTETEVSFVTPAGIASEAITVLSFDPTSITLESAIGIELPLGTQGMPIKYGFLRSKGSTNTFALNAEDLTLSFNVIEYRDIGALDMAYFDVHHIDGLPIIIDPAFFDGSQRGGQLAQRLDVLDSRTGDIASRRTEPLARPRLPVLIHINSLADQYAWRQFLYFIRGSWGSFYIPTDFTDLILGVDFTLGGNTMSIVNVGLAEVPISAPRRDLKIIIASGASAGTYYRRINTVIDAGPTETVTLDSVIPGAGTVPIADVKISWLYQVRLEGDSATFRHLRLGQSELRFQASGVIS